MNLKKNDIIEVDITDFGICGEGVAKAGPLPVFVRGAIKGERVRAKIVSVKPKFAFAVIDGIIKKSPDRVLPPCPVFSKCGGCDTQHLSYESELKYKLTSAQNTLKKISELDINISAVTPSSKEYNYRNKLSLPVRRGTDGEIRIGFFRKRSHAVVDTDDCILQTESVKELIAGFKDYTQKNGLTAYCEETGGGDVKHITVRFLGGVNVVTIVGTLKNAGIFKDFLSVLNGIYGPGRTALYYNENNLGNNVIYSKNFSFLGGVNEPIAVDGLKVRIHPAAFFQVNDNVRNALYSHTERIAINTNATTAIEAYAGAGMLAMSLSKKFKEVYALEISPAAVESGEEIKKLNGIENVRFICGDCEEKLPEILSKAGKDCVLILDPPRAGIDGKVIESVLTALPKNIIYISCNPATLGRDLGLLKTAYQIKDVTLFDMFPKTANVETVARLTLKEI